MVMKLVYQKICMTKNAAKPQEQQMLIRFFYSVIYIVLVRMVLIYIQCYEDAIMYIQEHTCTSFILSCNSYVYFIMRIVCDDSMHQAYIL